MSMLRIEPMPSRETNRVEWDPKDTVSTALAKETFDSYRRGGYIAYSMDGARGAEVLNHFDEQANDILMRAAYAGG